MLETDVTRFLDEAGVQYVVKPHQNDVFTCEDAAKERDVRLSQIVKCMVGADRNGGLHIMLIPGDKKLKIKRVRQVAGGIGIDLISPEDLKKKFSMIVGAISPTQFFGKAKFYMDNNIFREKDVDISSGNPNAGIELSSEKLCEILGAIRCDIISTSEESS